MMRAAFFVAGFLAAACTFTAWCCLYVGTLDDDEIEDW